MPLLTFNPQPPIPPQVGCPANVYAAIIKKGRTRGAKVILDTSGAALGLGIEAGPFAIKPVLPGL